MDKNLNIVLVYRSGGRYNSNDVRLLAFHLHKWAGDLKINVYCLFDKVVVPVSTPNAKMTILPMAHPEWKGWWSKMNLFSPQVLSLAPFLYLDLDTMILGDYSSILPSSDENFIALEDFYRKGRLASGMLWVTDTPKINFLWNMWIGKSNYWMTKYRGDGEFIHDTIQADGFWQISTDLVQSYKPQPKRKPITEKPKDCAILCFHGEPSIFKAAETNEWIKTYTNELRW